MAATAIVVPVPEAEAVAGSWRRRYTDDGTAGMYAHVTLIYPFVEEALLGAGHLKEIGAALAPFQSFDFRLAELAEFPSSGAAAPVLYLAPEPEDPFRSMTEALVAAFPKYPPYGGRVTSIVPHLTLAHAPAAPLAQIRSEVEPQLPIRARATEVHVVRYQDEGGWRTKSVIPLRAPRAASRPA